MSEKRSDFFDKMIFGFGLALGGVLLFVLLAGVVVALFSLLLEGGFRAARVRAVPGAGNGAASLRPAPQGLPEGGNADERKKREKEKEPALV